MVTLIVTRHIYGQVTRLVTLNVAIHIYGRVTCLVTLNVARHIYGQVKTGNIECYQTHLRPGNNWKHRMLPDTFTARIYLKTLNVDSHIYGRDITEYIDCCPDTFTGGIYPKTLMVAQTNLRAGNHVDIMHVECRFELRNSVVQTINVKFIIQF